MLIRTDAYKVNVKGNDISVNETKFTRKGFAKLVRGLDLTDDLTGQQTSDEDLISSMIKRCDDKSLKRFVIRLLCGNEDQAAESLRYFMIGQRSWYEFRRKHALDIKEALLEMTESDNTSEETSIVKTEVLV